MADSIVYEHDAIKKYCKVGKKYVRSDQLPHYKLVRSRGHVYSISTSYSSNSNITSTNFIIVKNLDESFPKNSHINPWTQMEKLVVKWDIGPNYKQIPTEKLDVFMYTDDLLFVGTKSNYNAHCVSSYGIWLFNLSNSTCYKHFTIGDDYIQVQKIIPLGQKYFQIEPAIGYYCNKSYVHTWEQLLKFAKQPVPNTYDSPDNHVKQVYIMDIGCSLYPVDWSSSSIGHLSSCAFLQTYPYSQQIDFLDGNFTKVMALDVTNFFPDYKPVDSPNKKFLIGINDNCLLFCEYELPDTSNIINPGQAHCYCWDFTNGKEIKFPDYECKVWVYKVVPFRASDNKVKYLAWENSNNNFWLKVYESTY